LSPSQARYVRRREALDEVELAGAQVREAHRRIDDRRVDDPVEVDPALVPIVRKRSSTIRSCAIRSTKRNGPEHTGFVPNFSPAASAAFGDTIIPARSVSTASSGANGEARLMRTVEGSTTSTLDDDRQLTAPVRALHVLVALEVVLDRFGVHLLAVVERDARSQLDHERLVVRRPFVRGRELRHDRELLVEVEQLVAQAREHDAPDERARHRRIEDVRVFRETDAKGLRIGNRNCRRKRAGCEKSHGVLLKGGTLPEAAPVSH
jgi:hypothetical protein